MASTAFLTKAYLAYFGRPVDYTGTTAFANSTELQVQNAFSASAESQALYGTTFGAAQINAIYNVLFGRDAEPAGLAYWANQVQLGLLTPAGAAIGILNGAQNADVTSVTNKLAASTTFTAGLDTTPEILGYSGDVAAASARDFLKTVTATPATQAAVDTAITAAVGSGAAVTGKTFTLTTGIDNIVGTAGNDTFTSDNTTLSAGDQINGGAGTDTLNYTHATSAATLAPASISGIEVLNLRNVGSGTLSLDASTVAGLTTVNADRATAAVAVTNLAAGASAGVVGNGTVISGAFNAGYVAAATAATLNFTGGVQGTTGGSDVAVSGTGLKSLTINSTGAANKIDDLTVAASVTSVVINAATDLSIGVVGGGTGLSGFAAGTTITISGAATTVDMSDDAVNANVKSIDASGLTAGGVKLGALNAGITSFKGGQGNDSITTGAITATGAVIDAGAGTGDTLILAATNDITTAAVGAQYTNFEVLKSLQTTSFDASLVAGITSVETALAGAGFSKLTAAQAANIKVSATLGSTATAYALANATGTSDMLGLNFANATATTVENATGLTVTGFETVNLTAGSGGKSLYNAAGTAQLISGTNYDSFAFANAADLKTVTLAGDYAAKVDLSSSAVKVTAVNASSNTAGAEIVVGGQTGNLVITGSESRDIITLTTAGIGGLQTVNAGGGNDSIFATQAVFAVATINGGAGTDTLTVTDTGPVTVNDNSFAGVSSIEKLAFGATDGLTFVVGGFANALATANAGVLDVTAAALAVTTGAVVVDATGLSASNSLKLSLTNSDATATAGAINVTLSQGADNITIKQAGATNVDTITINGGVAALASTAVKTIDLSGVTAGGAVTVTTGAGADVIKAAVGIAGTYTSGAGADIITLGAADNAVQTLNYSVANQSTTTAWDKVSGFEMKAGTGDLLDFTGTFLLTNANLGTGWTVSSGIATKAGATVADFIAAFSVSTVAGVAAFSDGADTYVAYSDGTAAVTTSDQVVQLVGVIGATSVATTAGANVIAIV